MVKSEIEAAYHSKQPKMNYMHMQMVHIICHVNLHSAKILKMIYLTHMISILNYVFNVMFYVMN
jgi:hypothetical protein